MTKILVIDDDEIVRDILRAQFEGRAYHVIDADDGDSGVAQARAEKPDLMVLDMNLPGMTGFEVLPILRTHPETRKIPVIALTAHDGPDDRDAAYDAGCDRYVSKPVDAQRLFKAVDDLIA